MLELIKKNITEEYGITESNATQIKNAFLPMIEAVESLEIDANKLSKEAESGITEQHVACARQIRLQFQKLRTGTDKKRKETKAEHKRIVDAIDGLARTAIAAITGPEERMHAIEKHFETLEAERKAELHESRLQELAQYSDDDMSLLDFGNMEESAFEMFVSGAKAKFEARIAEENRLAAESAKREAERLQREAEEKAERERLAEENRIMREEAERKRKEEEVEKAKREREAEEVRRAHEAKLAAEKAERDAIQAKADAERKALEDQLAAERKAKADAEAKRLADIKAAKEAEEKEQARLAKAGDKEKLAPFRTELLILRSHVPKLNDKALQESIIAMIDKIGLSIKDV